MGLEVCRYVCRPACDRRLVSRKASLLYGVIHLVNTQGKGVCKSVRLEVIELLVEGGAILSEKPPYVVMTLSIIYLFADHLLTFYFDIFSLCSHLLCFL